MALLIDFAVILMSNVSYGYIYVILSWFSS